MFNNLFFIRLWECVFSIVLIWNSMVKYIKLIHKIHTKHKKLFFLITTFVVYLVEKCDQNLHDLLIWTFFTLITAWAFLATSYSSSVNSMAVIRVESGLIAVWRLQILFSNNTKYIFIIKLIISENFTCNLLINNSK